MDMTKDNIDVDIAQLRYNLREATTALLILETKLAKR